MFSRLRFSNLYPAGPLRQDPFSIPLLLDRPCPQSTRRHTDFIWNLPDIYPARNSGYRHSVNIGNVPHLFRTLYLDVNSCSCISGSWNFFSRHFDSLGVCGLMELVLRNNSAYRLHVETESER